VSSATAGSPVAAQIAAAFSRALPTRIPLQIVDARPGDAAVCYADPSLAARELRWTAERDLDDMMADTWRWQSQNPNGYAVA